MSGQAIITADDDDHDDGLPEDGSRSVPLDDSDDEAQSQQQAPDDGGYGEQIREAQERSNRIERNMEQLASSVSKSMEMMSQMAQGLQGVANRPVQVQAMPAAQVAPRLTSDQHLEMLQQDPEQWFMTAAGPLVGNIARTLNTLEQKVMATIEQRFNALSGNLGETSAEMSNDRISSGLDVMYEDIGARCDELGIAYSDRERIVNDVEGLLKVRGADREYISKNSSGVVTRTNFSAAVDKVFGPLYRGQAVSARQRGGKGGEVFSLQPGGSSGALRDSRPQTLEQRLLQRRK